MLVKEGWGGIFILEESFVEKSHQRMLALIKRRMRGLRVYKHQQTDAAAKIEHRSLSLRIQRLMHVKKSTGQSRSARQ